MCVCVCEGGDTWLIVVFNHTRTQCLPLLPVLLLKCRPVRPHASVAARLTLCGGLLGREGRIRRGDERTKLVDNKQRWRHTRQCNLGQELQVRSQVGQCDILQHTHAHQVSVPVPILLWVGIL
jgi:hypothetical protein